MKKKIILDYKEKNKKQKLKKNEITKWWFKIKK